MGTQIPPQEGTIFGTYAMEINGDIANQRQQAISIVHMLSVVHMCHNYHT